MEEFALKGQEKSSVMVSIRCGERLESTKVVVVGILPDELDSAVEITNFQNHNCVRKENE